MYVIPSEIIPGRDRLPLDDGTARPVTATYPLTVDTWAVDVAEPGAMIQVPADVRVRVQRPA